MDKLNLELPALDGLAKLPACGRDIGAGAPAVVSGEMKGECLAVELGVALQVLSRPGAPPRDPDLDPFTARERTPPAPTFRPHLF